MIFIILLIQKQNCQIFNFKLYKMGGKHSHAFDQKLFNTQWQRGDSGLQGRTLWRNRAQPLIQIQQFPIYANTDDDIQREGQLFDLRKDSSELVAATHFKETLKGGLCSSAAQGRLFLQKIPLKLEALQHIPFPDILHLHSNALTGYKKLFKFTGAFRPQQQQIGFNSLGEVKIWLNGDFSASRPVSMQTSQFTMVRNLLQIIQDNTDHNTTPRENPSIINFIYRNTNQINFDQALSSVREYANQYINGIIPKNLKCIQKIGTDNIRKSLVDNRNQIGSQIVSSQRNNFNDIHVPTSVVSTVNSNFVQNRPIFVQNTQPIIPNLQPVNSTFQNVSTFGQVRNQAPIQVIQHHQVQGVKPQVQRVSGMRTSGINFNFSNVQQHISVQKTMVQLPSLQNLTQNKVQTVRPVQQMVQVRAPQQQRLIQQVVRQAPIQIVNQQIPQHLVLNQGSRVQQSQQVVFNGAPVSQISEPSQVFNKKVESFNINQIPQTIPVVSTIENTNQFSQNSNQIVQNLNQISSQVNTRAEPIQKQVSQSRNALESNTTSVGIGKTQFESFNTGNEKYQTGNIYETRNLGLNFEASQSRYKEVSLEDGKSSEALLAELRNISSGSAGNFKEFSSKNYQFETSKYSGHLKKAQSYEGNLNSYGAGNVQSYGKGEINAQRDEDSHELFNNYAKVNQLQDNLQMKYSMTQDLYEHEPAQQNYEYEDNNYQYQNGNDEYGNDDYEYQQGRQYQVDYDPQILADIEKMKN